MKKAIEYLKTIPSIYVLTVSPLYITKPMYVVRQPLFFNAVVKIKTILSPHRLLQAVKKLETTLGRIGTFRYGPRNIDMDILLYGRKKIKTKNLCIPHSAMHERKFVLQPLADIAPGVIHPILKKTVKTLLCALE